MSDFHQQLAAAKAELATAQQRIRVLESQLAATQSLHPTANPAELSLTDQVEFDPALLRRFHNQSWDVFGLFDDTGHASYISPSIQPILGYTPQEYIALPTLQVVHPDDIEVVLRNMHSLREHPSELHVAELRVRHQQGHWLWIEIRASNLTGSPLTGAFLACIRDISDRKQAEANLRQHDAVLVATMQNIAVGMATVALDGQIRETNKRFSEILGYSQTEIKALNFRVITYPEDLDLDLHYLHQLLNGEIPTFSMRKRYLHKDGKVVWANLTVCMVRDEANAPKFLIGFIEDLTHLAQIEADLHATRADYRQMIETAQEGIWIISNERGNVQFINQKMSEMLGYTTDELLGRPIYDLIHADSQAQMQSHVPSADSVHQEWQFIHKTGTAVWGLVTTSPLRDAQGTYGTTLGMVMNITERKAQEGQLLQALEQAQELSELKSRFISMASHEFRTPLAVMQMASDALSRYRRQMAESQIDTRLDKIRQQIGHMKMVMNKLLDLARHQAGYVDFNPTVSDLSAFCREIIEEFTSQPEHTGRMAYTDDLTNSLILFDAHLMRQVLSNLIQNGLKYSVVDQPIEISLKQTAIEISICVKDRGIGIPATDLAHLFKPFHRASNVGTIPGTGLGLSLIDQAVTAHRGKIAVESEVGQGTTFTVTIPR